MSSDILTVARVPGISGAVFMAWDRLSRAEIIKLAKEQAAYEKEKWEKVLATTDDQFECRIVRGLYKQELVEKL